jgi:hypothetical protein
VFRKLRKDVEYVQNRGSDLSCDLLQNICFEGGHAVAQLVEALRYNPERGGFDARWCHGNFLLT